MPRRDALQHEEGGKTGIAAARHVMLGTVADAEDAGGIADEARGFAVNLCVGLADPCDFATHLFVKRGDGARRGHEALWRQHQLVRVAADGGERDAGEQAAIIVERGLRRVGAEDEDDLGVTRISDEGDAVKAIVLAVLADEEGGLRGEAGEGDFAGADRIDEVIARHAHFHEALAVRFRALAGVGHHRDGHADPVQFGEHLRRAGVERLAVMDDAELVDQHAVEAGRDLVKAVNSLCFSWHGQSRATRGGPCPRRHARSRRAFPARRVPSAGSPSPPHWPHHRLPCGC